MGAGRCCSCGFSSDPDPGLELEPWLLLGFGSFSGSSPTTDQCMGHILVLAPAWPGSSGDVGISSGLCSGSEPKAGTRVATAVTTAAWLGRWSGGCS